jgi:hypothetical protein
MSRGYRVMQRAGHLNFSTTQGYIREAEAVGIDAGAPFPPLPSALSQSAVTGSWSADQRDPQSHPARERYARYIERVSRIAKRVSVASVSAIDPRSARRRVRRSLGGF